MLPTPLTTALARMQNVHRDAVESAAHPSSKPHREAHRAFQKCLAEITSAVQQMQQEHEKQWTPVTEKLPDDELLALIAVNDDDVWTGYVVAGVWRYVDGFPIATERVTHWMPMPAPPTRSEA